MANKHLATFLIGLSLAFSPVFADDNETTVEGSNTSRFDQGNEVDVRLAERAYPNNTVTRRFFENRLRLDVFRGNLRVGGRLLYFRPSEADQAQFGLENESRIDKRYFEATLEPLKVRAGHFSGLWGNGLVYSSFENRDLYFDSELDGLNAQLDVGPLVVTALRGSSQDGYLVKEAEVTGAHVGGQIGGSGLGFSYVFIDSSYYPKDRTVRGIDWRLARGMATVYGERAWNKMGVGDEAPEGHATYVGLVLSKWNWSLLFDYKDYDYGQSTPFQNPPTAYREVGPRLLQGREPHVLDPADEVGFQIELSGKATPKTFLTVHYNLTSRHDPEDGFIPLPTLQQIHSPYWESFASIEHDLPAERHIIAELGANEQAGVRWQERKWVWAKFQNPLRGKSTIEFETEQMLITDRTRNDREFWDQLYGIGWEATPSLSLALQAQFSDDEELLRKEGQAKLLTDLGLFSNVASWLSAEAAMLFSNGAHRLIVFYGRERGGLKCSNGVCRQVQAFSGWRLTLETSL